MDKVRILNVNFDNVSMDEAVKLLYSHGGFVCTPNVDHIMKMQRDCEFYKIVKKADFVFCDSQIIIFTSKILKRPIKERVAGSDLFPRLYTKYRDKLRIFLLGGDNQTIADKARVNINRKVGVNIVVGAYSPPFGFEKSETETRKILSLIKKSKANVLVVGVGAPKQEKWIWKHKDLLPNIHIFLPIGASINMEAGALKKAPEFLSKLGLEWLFRLCQEPKRLFKRYLIEDLPFFYLICKDLFCKYKNPCNGVNNG